MPRAFVALVGFSAIAGGAAAGCSGDPYVVDPFPVSVTFAHGVPQLYGCAPELVGGDCGAHPLTVVLDTGSPLTTVDIGLDAGTPIRRVHTSLDLDGLGSGGLDAGGEGAVTRARFLGFTAFAQPLGPIGVECHDDLHVEHPGVVVGGDRLSTLAVRLDPTKGEMFFFPNIAGADEVLARECKGVVPTTRLGGGDYLIDGAQVGYAATRLVVGACLDLDANPTRETIPLERRPQRRGTDALLVVATGLPVTVLSRSAWEHACKQDQNPRTPAAHDAGMAGDPGPAPDAGLGACATAPADAGAAGDAGLAPDDPCFLAPGTMHFPGTPPGTSTAVSLGTLSWLGLAADEVRDRRGPCQEIAASRIMDLGGCSKHELACGVCPCENGAQSCRAGASLEVAGPIQVAVVEDTDPVLQALRDELRPVVADVDGFLGMNALRTFVTDFDYPHSRLVFRCDDDESETCVVRPRLPSLGDRASLASCLGRQFFVPTATADTLPGAAQQACPP